MVSLDFVDMSVLSIDFLYLTHAMVPTVVQHRSRLDGLSLCLSVCLSVCLSSRASYG